MSTTMSQPNKPQSLLTNPTTESLLFAAEREEDLLEMINAAASMDWSEEAKRAIDVIGEAMTLVCYTYDADF